MYAIDTTTAGAKLIDNKSAVDCYILEAAYFVNAVLAISIAFVVVTVVVVVVVVTVVAVVVIAVVFDIQYWIEAFTK